MNSLFKSLSFRIWLPFAASISLLLLSLLVLYPKRQEELFRKNFDSELNQLARSTALGVEVALDHSDFENLGQIVELVTKSANLEFVAITEIDSLGKEQVFVTNPQNYDPGKILNLDSANLLVQSESFTSELSSGRVILAITKDSIDDAIFEINYPIYVFLGILMILSLGLFYGLARRISAPISYLTEVSNQMKTGNYELDINLVSQVNEPWLIYPLHAINLWELGFMLMLAYQLKKYFKDDFTQSLVNVLLSYGSAFLLWIVFVVFITLNLS